MDPLVCKHLSSEEKKEAEKLIKKDKALISSIKQSNTSKKSAPLKKSFLDDFAALCSVDDNSNQSNTINFDIDKEFIIYHQTKTLEEDFSKYWQSYSGQLHILAVFVQHYSIIPASSVSSEAAFSIANYYQRKERSNLSSKSLRYSMILRECFNELNSDFLFSSD